MALLVHIVFFIAKINNSLHVIYLKAVKLRSF